MNNFKLIFLLAFLCGSPFAQETPAPTSVPQTVPSPSPFSIVPAPPPAAKSAVAYENFLDSMETLARAMLPEKERLDSLKAIVNAESPVPRDEFEKQAEYEKRIAAFEKAKQQKMADLEQEYRKRTKEPSDKIKSGIASKEDLQPDWAGMLKKDAASTEIYKERDGKLREKIAEMTSKISLVGDLLGRLNFSQSEIKTLTEHWQRKTMLYFSRLERAQELMQDYIVQEQAKVLATEKKKAEISLGIYNPEKEEFEITMNDTTSQTVPFDFSGTIKMPPAQAKETNRQTDNFTASVDYINYPFITEEMIFYPGAKKARVYYKSQELPTMGSFKNVQRLSDMPGYSEWVIYADSLLSGKLKPKNLDQVYVMSTKITKKIETDIPSHEPNAATFWTMKNTMRIAAFAISAASLGLGIWQDGNVKNNGEKMNQKYLEAGAARGTPEYEKKYSEFKKSADDVDASQNLRMGFYIGSGVFGAIGIATFFF
jgi:hypothetical protein